MYKKDRMPNVIEKKNKNIQAIHASFRLLYMEKICNSCGNIFISLQN